MSHSRLVAQSAMLLAVTLGFTACEQAATAPDVDVAPSYAKGSARASSFQGGPAHSLTAQIDAVNAQFAARGSTLRLDYPWLFTVGPGTDPYARLRIGVRWTTLEPTYTLDVSDFPTSPATGEVEAALVAAYGSWNAIPNSALEAHRIGDSTSNPDYLDGTYDVDGTCMSIEDEDFDLMETAADIVVGGWLPETYFSDCLETSGIIAVTWPFIRVDAEGNPVDTNGDQYIDLVYVEQYFNAGLPWVTGGSQYLTYAQGFDVQTIAVHEDGHAHGLGHFGGPLLHQPFPRDDGTFFSPEAVMNPYYLGGEKRDPLPTDVAGMLTMYARR